MRCLHEAIVTIPTLESLHSLHLGTLDPRKIVVDIPNSQSLYLRLSPPPRAPDEQIRAGGVESYESSF